MSTLRFCVDLVQLCLKTVLSAHYQAFPHIYSGQKYKNEDDTIIMIM